MPLARLPHLTMGISDIVSQLMLYFLSKGSWTPNLWCSRVGFSPNGSNLILYRERHYQVHGLLSHNPY